MNLKIDAGFCRWLDDIAKEWGVTIDDVANELARNEIEDREKYFPQIKKALFSQPIDLDGLFKLGQESWPLGGHFDIIRLSGFLKNREFSEQIIRTFIKDFPENDKRAIDRINEFIEEACLHGYVNERNMPDRAGAALLASVILTSIFPDKFVDFRTQRWQRFYEIFPDEESFPKKESYGKQIIWASNFAKELIQTKTFKRYWPDEPPLWLISSFAWIGRSPNRDESSDETDDDFQKSYPEGKWKERLHKYRERKSAVVKRAKILRLKKDPLLKCDVCGFSFLSQYGVRGERFIEAHHTIPLESLSPGDITRVEDIALVCSNCHRMLHRGEETMSISELQKIIHLD